MKERPILFSGAMVRAILSGAKTQTRRIAPIQSLDIYEHDGGLVTLNVRFTKPIGKSRTIGSYSGGFVTPDKAQRIIAAEFCPYGKPGDRLAVRETWRYCGWTEDGLPFVECQADGAQRLCDRGISEEWAEKLGDIWADLSDPQNFELDGRAADRRWRPSIHMPRWASRLTLEITGVRVERLNEISDEDALAEGVYPTATWLYQGSPRAAYRKLWDSINVARRPKLPSNTNSKRYNRVKAWLDNNPDTTSWDANPWVWVVEFRRIEP